MNRKILLFVGIVLLVFFALFSRYIKQGGMRSVDFALTVKLQERIDKSQRLRTARMVGEVMEGSTFLASPEVSIIAVFVLTILALKRKGWRAIVIPMVFTLLVLAESYGKTVVHHPTPPFFMIKNPTTIFPRYYINDEFSYPSGHAARAVFLSIVSYLAFSIGHLSLKKRVVIGLSLGLYVLLVSVSRIYLGHHWLSDIIGGGMVGSAFALIMSAIL